MRVTGGQWQAALLLALLLRAAAAPPVTPATLDQERNIMLALRRSVQEARPVDASPQRFWQVDSDAAHCTWEWVTCDRRGHVSSLTVDINGNGGAANSSSTGSTAGTKSGGPPSPGPLLASLASLSRLQSLSIQPVGLLRDPVPMAAIPSEWGHPGAFPALTRLIMEGHHIAGQLPDVRPGALPQLQTLHIEALELTSPLPAGWGDAGVLPELLELVLTIRLQGGLPPGWARGFPSLLSLRVGQGQPSWRHSSLPRPQGSSLRLPPEWASATAFPRLQSLELVGLPLGGRLPQAWVQGGFRNLNKLMVSPAQLTGTLPPEMFARHPGLLSLDFSGNWLHGTLPSTYGRSKAWILQFAHNPNISGPAFPSAWLEAGALPRLVVLDLSGTAVTGTLPPTMPWPRLETLKLAGTRVEGSFPDSWCRAPFAGSLYAVWVNGTAASQARPACVKHDMPMLDRASAVNASSSATAVPGMPREGRSAALPVALGTLLPLTALAIGSRLLLRQRRRAKQLAHHSDSESGLSLQPTIWPGSSNGSSGSSGRAGAQVPAARRQRLAALLSKRPAGTIEMLPLGKMQQTQLLAHQVSSGSSSEEANTHFGHADQGDPGAAEAGQLLGKERPAWRLPTDSLRIKPAQLQFVADEAGKLISLGSGTHGDVFLARLDSVQVAVKVIELGALLHSGRVWQEIHLLRRASHPRIVKLLGVGVEDGIILMATQLMPRGSLRTALRDPEAREELQWRRRGRTIALDVAEALDYMHTQLRMLHSDLKCANVLLDQEWRASVADLGLSQVLNSLSRTAVGFSRVYAAPEVLLGQRCTLAADVHSFGVLLAFLLTGLLSEKRGQWRLPRAPEECPQAVVQLISDCTSPDPKQRPTAAQVLHRLREAATQG